MPYFIDAVLPIPIQKTFTYAITQGEADFLEVGMRVAVPFGKSKIYTALVMAIHQKEPVYQTKEIYQILEDSPVVTQVQLSHWQWIASYYMATLGEVYKAALPATFLLTSETTLYKNESFVDADTLTDEGFLIFEALQNNSQLTIDEVVAVLGNKKTLPTIDELIKKGVITVREEIYEKYKPKLVKYVRLSADYLTDDALEKLVNQLDRAKKQRAVILSYFQLASAKKLVKPSALQKEAGVSSTVLKSLVNKNMLEFYTVQIDRIQYNGTTKPLEQLNEFQKKAYAEVQTSFVKNDVTLLHGITGSGKTEIYVQLIQAVLKTGKQVLFLLPEIALTAQIILRLQSYFGKQVAVYHSKYTVNERVEVWNNVLKNKTTAKIILGTRSAIFLPFKKLGLIIVDEEHETAYKQFDPAPRYNTRDAAIVLANYHQAKILLGSATPSIESYFNAQQQKYGLVELSQRFGSIELPEIELINLKEKSKDNLMTGYFSDTLLILITKALKNKEQVILFQNRRGFSPVVSCATCGNCPQCPNCDVSLTYHQFKKELKCHYCHYGRAMPHQCDACGSPILKTKGFGTEQIEVALSRLFPDYTVGRMDLDTTRGKYGYQKIIGAFQAQEIDILVGTQMLSKGLDFANVSLVGILNADSLLNFPDFRAYERAFQLMVQVSGRAGRSKKRGKVAIQTYNPYRQILKQVETTNYTVMYKEQLQERWQYHYPPYYRLVKMTLKHKNYQKVNDGISWLTTALKNIFFENVLGPSEPSISRVRNQYIKNLVLKIPPKQSLLKTKQQLQRIKNRFEAIPDFRAIRFGIDVDAY